MSDAVLRTENITMQFGGVVAVNDISIEIKRGGIFALIGPNGAGKTTLFNCITGVYAPTNGAVWFQDRLIVSNHPAGKMRKDYLGSNPEKFTQVVQQTPDRITKLGIARTFQNIRLFSALSALDNVLIAKHLHMKAGILADTFRLNRAEEKKMREDALALLEILGLGNLKDEISGSLPYGQQRRLEIARALATGPSLLLLDEPAAGMNPQETEELTAFIRQLRRDFDLSIFMIEHHMDLVMEISDHIYVLDFGKQIAEGSPDEIQNNQLVIDAYLGVDKHGEQ